MSTVFMSTLRSIRRLQSFRKHFHATTAMSASLPITIHQGILNVPGATPESKATAERLLEEDRKTNHSLFRAGFHNHLSHHVLAAYDLGAPAKLLQAIYDRNQTGLAPLRPDTRDRKEPHAVTITQENWTRYLGSEYDHLYADYLEFFAKEIERSGVCQVLEDYVFSPAANGNGTYMLLRFIGGAVHPMIQTGYGVEFGSDVMVAQALAQVAAHNAFVPELFDFEELSKQSSSEQPKAVHPNLRQPSTGRSLLSILREAYDSPTLHPVMPYDPDALLSKRQRDALKDGRPEEIRRLTALWKVDISRGQQEFDEKLEEFLWVTTLLLAGTSKRGRKPRLDFFLMHMLNVMVFVPSLLNVIQKPEHKALLLRATVPVLLMYLIMRGRPRIDPELLMSYTADPRPLSFKRLAPDASAIGDPRKDEFHNPWPTIVASVLHAPDPHTLKAIRALYYSAQNYGTTPAGGAIGAFQLNGEETHKGMGKADGTIFIRAAGVVMDTLGWVSHGQEEGHWDRSGLGWDDAWKSDGIKSV